MSRRFNLRVCSLNYDRKDRLHPGCHGPVIMIGRMGLCPRHLRILNAIKADAIANGTYAGGVRHPVHRGRGQAA